MGGVAFAGALAWQGLHVFGELTPSFANWRPVLYAHLLATAALAASLLLLRGEAGRRALFILAASVCPTLFGAYLALADWNLSSFDGPKLNELANLLRGLQDPHFWNAVRNMGFYIGAVLIQYVIAFGLALLLMQELRARRFFRVVFLIPFMLSPIAVSRMSAKSMMEFRFGPLSALARLLGWETPAFFASPWTARYTIEAIDAWMFIPFIVLLLLAGLQAIPKELGEAASIDGGRPGSASGGSPFP